MGRRGRAAVARGRPHGPTPRARSTDGCWPPSCATRFDPARAPLLRLPLVPARRPTRATGSCSPTTTCCSTAGRCRCCCASCSRSSAGGDRPAAAGRPTTAPTWRWLAGAGPARPRGRWRAALAGLDGPTLLAPAGAAGRSRRRRAASSASCRTAPTAGAGRALARRRGLTLNTVVQAAWGLLLGALTGRDDVVFGTTVAGRPAEVPGVESMVGLFINTVPVRVRLDPGEPVGDAAAPAAGRAGRAARPPAPRAGRDPARWPGTASCSTRSPCSRTTRRRADATAAPRRRRRSPACGSRDAAHYPLSLTARPGARLRLELEHRRRLVPPAADGC